jgi:plasmid stabilization system protein ParE
LKVTFTSAANVDLVRLWRWLDEKNPKAATHAMEAITGAARSLSQFPHRGYGGLDGHRQLRVPFGKRGYVIRYTVTDAEVRIVRIFHGLEDR